MLAAALVAASSPARAQAPAPAVEVSAYTWSRAAIGSPDTAIKFGGGLEVRGPLAIGSAALGDIAVRLDIESLPDKGIDFEDLGTWGTYAELSGSWSKRVGFLEVEGGSVATSVIVRGRTTFEAIDESDVGRRALRAWGGGLEVEHRSARGVSRLAAVYGRDEAVGTFAWGQLQVDGTLAIKQAVRFFGRVGLGFGPASIAGDQSDYILAGVGLDLLDLF